MSGRLVGEVLQDRLEDAPVRQRQGLRAVLVVLAEAARPDNPARLNNATIAERALMSERQVVRLLHVLEQLGRIEAPEGRSGGRGRATRWRVLGAAREAVKGDTTSPIDEAERVTRQDGKGDTQMSPEPYEPIPPLPPHRAERPAGAPATSAPTLPGLGRGEEGIAAIGGGPRSAGSGRRRGREQRQAAVRRRDLAANEAAERRHAQLMARLEAEEAAARSPEGRVAARAAREAALASTAVGRELLEAQAARWAST